ncbi:hypothetical protein BS329_17925 [Amycolatopsis coloradensis]|uniref:Uncharacterized protein n=1 Tax=Amycolatopsis coloradensis TaxID=76021 RepID=A0A1R0KT95_9PSEU|nr:hypothetical protein [Amycolatopsis coloradensis]OLZ51119.1 hypothetical protein BS329_17925 [Amycolatopsis coloradensis]
MTALTDRVKSLAKYMRLLHELQQHTDTIITTPNLSTYFDDQHKIWHFVAKILKGEPVTVTANEGVAFQLVLAPGTAAPRVPL